MHRPVANTPAAAAAPCQVRMVQAAADELQHVRVFAAHMRRAAARLQVGVNGLPGTPHLGRVVEMQALTQALRAAFNGAALDDGRLLAAAEAAAATSAGGTGSCGSRPGSAPGRLAGGTGCSRGWRTISPSATAASLPAAPALHLLPALWRR